MFAEAFGMGKRLIASLCVMHGDPAVCIIPHSPSFLLTIICKPTINVASLTGEEEDYWWELTLFNEKRLHPNVLLLIRQFFGDMTEGSGYTTKMVMAAILLSWIGQAKGMLANFPPFIGVLIFFLLFSPL
jgi:hypothetical protein